MLNNTTIDKLIEMHLTPMADAYRIQMNDPNMKEVSFEDRFGILVDIESTTGNALEKYFQPIEYKDYTYQK